MVTRFQFFEALNDAFEVQIFQALFYTISQTLIAHRVIIMQLRIFFYVEILWNNRSSLFSVDKMNLPWNLRLRRYQ